MANAAAPDVIRHDGANRYETAANAASGSTIAVLAASQGNVISPDGVVAGGIAGALGADIYLTAHDNLPQPTEDALVDNGVTDVHVLGGLEAVSQTVLDQLDDLGVNVIRYAGANRQETSTLAAAEVGPTDTAIFVGYFGMADALTAGPVAFANQFPILTNGAGDTINPDVDAAIDANNYTDIIVMGGTAVVSDAVVDALEAKGLTVVRVGGANRVETGTLFADYAVANLGASILNVGLVNGFEEVGAADAYPSATVLGALNGVTLITRGDVLAGFAEGWLQDNAGNIDFLHIFGGLAAISQAVEDAAVAAADDGQTTGTSVTARPELSSAAIVSTTTSSNASVTNPCGTTIAYTFDEALTAFTLANFVAYNAAATRFVPAAAAGICGAQAPAAAISSTDNTTVNVLFPNLGTAALAAGLTTAAVELGAVTGTGPQTGNAVADQNPEGDAPIGTGGQATLTPGTTAAPDVQSIAGFRNTLVPGTVAVDVTFDQAAFVQVGGAAPGLAGTGFFLASTDGRVVECNEPAEPSSGNTTPSGQNTPGGNGTTIITVTCPQYPATGTLPVTTATVANTARGIVQAGTVGTTPSASTVNGVTPAVCFAANADVPPKTNACNPLQVTQSPDLATSTPDLQSATLTIAANTNPGSFDQVVYQFDANINPATVGLGSFAAYLNTGAEVAAGGVTPYNGGTTAFQVSGNQVFVAFLPQSLAAAVGANVDAGGAQDVAGAPAPTNMDDEVGMTNATASTSTPGVTGAPDLTAVTLTSQMVGPDTLWTAIYTLDEALGGAVTAAGAAPQLFLHLADGSRMVCTNAVIGTGANGLTTSQVACTAYTFVDPVQGTFPDQSGTHTGAATQAQVGAAVLGTVNQQAAPAAGDLADAAGNFTPEGAAVTTGGTA